MFGSLGSASSLLNLSACYIPVRNSLRARSTSSISLAIWIPSSHLSIARYGLAVCFNDSIISSRASLEFSAISHLINPTESSAPSARHPKHQAPQLLNQNPHRPTYSRRQISHALRHFHPTRYRKIRDPCLTRNSRPITEHSSGMQRRMGHATDAIHRRMKNCSTTKMRSCISERLALRNALETLADLQKIACARKPSGSVSREGGRAIRP